MDHVTQLLAILVCVQFGLMAAVLVSSAVWARRARRAEAEVRTLILQLARLQNVAAVEEQRLEQVEESLAQAGRIDPADSVFAAGRSRDRE